MSIIRKDYLPNSGICHDRWGEVDVKTTIVVISALRAMLERVLRQVPRLPSLDKRENLKRLWSSCPLKH